MAAAQGNIDVLKYYIEKKNVSANYYEEKRNVGALLAEAATHGHFEICKYLISKGAKIDYRPSKSSGEYLHSALERAAQSGQLDIVKYLVEEHHAKLYDALKLAEKEKKAEVVKYLRTAFAKEISQKKILIKELRKDA